MLNTIGLEEQPSEEISYVRPVSSARRIAPRIDLHVPVMALIQIATAFGGISNVGRRDYRDKHARGKT